VVRSSLEREQSIGFRNTTVNIVKAIGPILTGSAVFFDGASLAAAHHKAVFQGIAGVFSGAFEAGLELVAPDQTVRQLINLDNHSLRDGIIIANNTQIRSIVFVDRELISRSLRNLVKGPASQLEAEKVGASIGMWSGMRKKDYDPQAVMAALGSLHLVGRSIAYLNRVSVISNAPGPAPTVTGATGNSATAGGSPVTLTLTGDSLSGATLTSPDPKLVITNPTVGDGGKSFTATIDPKNATAQTYQLTLSTASGSIAVQFVVNAPPPSITSTAGASAIAGGSPATLTLTGVSLAGATLSSPDSSLLITSQKASADGTSFTATIDPQKATAKTYPLTLTVGTVTLTVQFKVTTS
jgi:hypothetical protein